MVIVLSGDPQGEHLELERHGRQVSLYSMERRQGQAGLAKRYVLIVNYEALRAAVEILKEE